jgi:four helix bundle protein
MAEGYGRYTYTDTRNFFIIARGSITETMENLTAAFDESYITPDELREGKEGVSWFSIRTTNLIPNSKPQNPN